MSDQNPKLSGSRCHALYERYKVGTTIKAVQRLGARRGDIFNDLARGYTVMTDPLHARQHGAPRGGRVLAAAPRARPWLRDAAALS